MMETILIQTENAEQVKLVQAFLEKNKLKSRFLSQDDKEDFMLGKLMEETDYEQVVDTDSFIRNLRS